MPVKQKQPKSKARNLPPAMRESLRLPLPAKTIASLPFTISTPGVYRLASDLSFAAATGAAITIDADDVLVDLAGFTLSGSAGAAATAVAIQSEAHSNLTIRNGAITGFYRGVYITGDSAHGCLTEDLFVHDVTFVGIEASGWGHVIRRNRLLHITGNPDVATGGNGCSGAIGAFGAGNAVLDNDIEDVYGTHGTPHGSFGTLINLNASIQSIAENNRLINRTFEPNSFGIYVGDSPDVLVIGNRIVNLDMAVCYHGTSTGAYRDNLTQACNKPYTGGTDAGGNR